MSGGFAIRYAKTGIRPTKCTQTSGGHYVRVKSLFSPKLAVPRRNAAAKVPKNYPKEKLESGAKFT